MINWIRKKIREWLGVDALAALIADTNSHYQRQLNKVLDLVVANDCSLLEYVNRLKSRTYGAADIDMSGRNRIIVLEYNVLSRNVHVIADECSGLPDSYMKLVWELREKFKKHKCDSVAVDMPKGNPYDMSARMDTTPEIIECNLITKL